MLDPELEGHTDVNTRPDFDTRLSRLDAEHKEEFGRFTRLLIGLSAGAVTIVSTILTKGTTAGLLTWSLGFSFYIVVLRLGSSFSSDARTSRSASPSGGRIT